MWWLEKLDLVEVYSILLRNVEVQMILELGLANWRTLRFPPPTS